MIPYGKQTISENDIKSVVDVLRSDFLTQGPVVPQFEEQLCCYTGVKYATAVNSCTSALHIACLSLDLGPGDILWTSAITFAASANCALYCGASVDFVDIDLDTCLMSTESLRKKLEQSEIDGNLPKIVIPVHFSGQCCDMEDIYALSIKYGFSIIEDAAHAIGAKYKSEFVGNCRYSDITVFSFHPVKVITTGEGGAALTNNPELAERMSLFRSHGITKDPHKMKKKPEGGWYYEQISLGFNYRMTDLQAALGISQLSRINLFIKKREDIVYKYSNELDMSKVSLLKQKDKVKSSHHLCVIKLNKGGRNLRDSLYYHLQENSINVQIHYIPLYRNKFYNGSGCKEGYINSEKYYDTALTIPLFPDLQESQRREIVDLINSYLD
jgi:UDP-4-amino-4,6-dideoxy-N-acetyl-beta-L-altrosamine transaminase